MSNIFIVFVILIVRKAEGISPFCARGGRKREKKMSIEKKIFVLFAVLVITASATSGLALSLGNSSVVGDANESGIVAAGDGPPLNSHSFNPQDNTVIIYNGTAVPEYPSDFYYFYNNSANNSVITVDVWLNPGAEFTVNSVSMDVYNVTGSDGLVTNSSPTPDGGYWNAILTYDISDKGVNEGFQIIPISANISNGSSVVHDGPINGTAAVINMNPKYIPGIGLNNPETTDWRDIKDFSNVTGLTFQHSNEMGGLDGELKILKPVNLLDLVFIQNLQYLSSNLIMASEQMSINNAATAMKQFNGSAELTFYNLSYDSVNIYVIPEGQQGEPMEIYNATTYWWDDKYLQGEPGMTQMDGNYSVNFTVNHWTTYSIEEAIGSDGGGGEENSTVCGYVWNKSMGPLSEVSVHIYGGMFENVTTTNINGYYEIRTPAGHFNIDAEKMGYSSNQSEIDVPVDATVWYNITLTEEGGAEGNYTVNGTIYYDGTETGTVYLRVMYGQGNPYMRQPIGASSTFSLEYSVEVEAGTYYFDAFIDVVANEVFDGTEPLGMHPNPVTVSHNISNIDIVISGSDGPDDGDPGHGPGIEAEPANVSGYILNGSKVGIPNVTVVVGSKHAQGEGPTNWTKTDSKGHYNLTGYVGEGDVLADAFGYRRNHTTERTFSADNIVNLTLKDAVSSDGAVDGFVRNSTGAGVKNALVVVVGEGPEGPGGEPIPVGADITSLNGYYHINGIPVGTCEMIVFAKGYAPKFEDYIYVSSGATERINFELGAGGTVTGRVTNTSNTTEGIANVEIGIFDPWGGYETSTNTNDTGYYYLTVPEGLEL